ncbi:hypothetical protein D1631_11970 [Chryseobacterium nematophagum]|uniref:Uncharacterized protein n=1 Tax=Chryseobacterium nematophagum TaxID=2305228 RepID=A0A3M7TIW2_9FLAO|nr:FISUMP domain-containing protein [Chryseobacterium nematophagum]RNA62599.1 hypothetical protein D1631_11970 [Chryseobacterium nematophagum]
MKKTNLLVSMLLGVFSFGQVGINNQSPKITLDIMAKNSDGSTSEGFIPPRLTGNALFAAIASGVYGSAQGGAIVFVTEPADVGNQVGQTIRVDTRGYYYFDSASSQWWKLGTGSNFYNSDGTLSSTRHVTMDNHNLGYVGGRIGMGTFSPDPSAILDLISSDNGFLPPRMLKTEMNAIANPALGLVVFCTDCFDDIGCLMVNDSNNPGTPNWGSVCSSNIPIGHIDNLSCGSAILSGTLQSGVVVSGVSVTVPYTGGNAGTYSSAVFNSTGVTGLNANLLGATLLNGNGDITFTISGTPSAAGTASFNITVAGKTCTLTVDVDPFTASVTSIDCASAVFSPSTITQGEAYTGTLTIPYTGGNGEPYPQLPFTQNGLTFTLPAGTLATGNGNFVYNVTGSATASGAMTIPISFGGTSCSVNTTVATNPVGSVQMCDGKNWASYNLGADTSFDANIPVKEIHGNYYQWGIKDPVADTDTPPSSISGWNTVSAPDLSWNTGTEASPVKNMANDPCPVGFRVPTHAEWTALNNCSSRSTVGTFSDDPANFGAGLIFTFGGNTLMLPAAGLRHYSEGVLFERGLKGYYWSSGEDGADYAFLLRFNPNPVFPNAFAPRTSGLPVRCISE